MLLQIRPPENPALVAAAASMTLESLSVRGHVSWLYSLEVCTNVGSDQDLRQSSAGCVTVSKIGKIEDYDFEVVRLHHRRWSRKTKV